MRIPFLEWINSPRSDRGVRFLRDDGRWEYIAYPDLANRSLALAQVLQEEELQPLDRLAVVTPAPQDFFTAFFAAQVIGVTIVPITPPLPIQSRMAYFSHVAPVLRDARPHAILTSPLTASIVAESLPAERRSRLFVFPDALPLPARSAVHHRPVLSLIQYTSGSTSTPRGVKIPWEKLAAQTRLISDWLNLKHEDGGAFWIPHYHDMGLISCLTAIEHQGNLMIMRPDQFIRNPLEWLACFSEYGATVAAAPNLGYELVLRHWRRKARDLDLSRWHTAIIGAEPVNAHLLTEFIQMFAPAGFRPSTFRPAYGMAEATLAVTGMPRHFSPRAILVDPCCFDIGQRPRVEARRVIDGTEIPEVNGKVWLTSAGRPLGPTAVHTRDEEGNLLPPGAIGEIWVRTPSLGAGYFHRPSGDRFTAAGFRTGDVGFVYEDELYVLGRVADRIKLRGLNIYAEHVEERIRRRVNLRPGSVLVLPGIPGHEQGIVVLWERRGHCEDTAEVRAAIADAARDLLGRAINVDVRLVPPGTIPRTTSGKPRRTAAWYQLQRTHRDREHERSPSLSQSARILG